MTDQGMLTRTLVELADTLVADFDVADLLSQLVDRCVEILDVSAAGLMLASPDGDLRLVTSSSDTMRFVELFELQASEGPCVDSHRSGLPVFDHTLHASGGPWPQFSPIAFDSGFRTVHAIPMRRRGTIVGVLNLFVDSVSTLSDEDRVAARALADMATISILQDRVVREAKVVNDQLNRALTSRIVIEQAKGVLAERAGVEVSEAFAQLRHHARSDNLRLVDVARDLVDGTLNALGQPPR